MRMASPIRVGLGPLLVVVIGWLSLGVEFSLVTVALLRSAASVDAC
jgi:hypothetical protein